METTTHRSHGLPLDIKGEGGYVVGAPSVLLYGGAYRRLSRDLGVATVDARELAEFIAQLEAKWPGARTARRHCDRGQQQTLADFGHRAGRPSLLRLASSSRGER